MSVDEVRRNNEDVDVVFEEEKEVKFSDEYVHDEYIITPLPIELEKYRSSLGEIIEKLVKAVVFGVPINHLFLAIGRGKTFVATNVILKTAYIYRFGYFDFSKKVKIVNYLSKLKDEVEEWFKDQVIKYEFQVSGQFPKRKVNVIGERIGKYPIVYVVVPGVALQFHYIDFFRNLGFDTVIPSEEAWKIREKIREITGLDFEIIWIMGKKRYECPLKNDPDPEVRKKAYKCATCEMFIKWRIEHVSGKVEVDKPNVVTFINPFGEMVIVELPSEEPECEYARSFYRLYKFLKNIEELGYKRKFIIVIINFEALLRHVLKLPAGLLWIFDEYDSYVINVQSVEIDYDTAQALTKFAVDKKLPFGSDLLVQFIRITSKDVKMWRQKLPRELIIEFLDYLNSVCEEVLTHEDVELSEKAFTLCHGIRELAKVGGSFAVKGTPGFVYSIYSEDPRIEIAFQRIPIISMISYRAPIILMSGTPLNPKMVTMLLRASGSEILFIEPTDPNLRKLPGKIILHHVPFIERLTYRKLFTFGKPDRKRFLKYCVNFAKILYMIKFLKEKYQPCYILPYPWYCITECLELAKNENIVNEYPVLKIFSEIEDKIDYKMSHEKFVKLFTMFLEVCKDPLKIQEVNDDFIVFATNRITRGINLRYLKSIIIPKYPLMNVRSAFVTLCVKKFGLDVPYLLTDATLLQALGRGARIEGHELHVFTLDTRVASKVLDFAQQGLFDLGIVSHDEKEFENIHELSIDEAKTRFRSEIEHKIQKEFIVKLKNELSEKRIEYTTWNDKEVTIRVISLPEEKDVFEAVVDVVDLTEKEDKDRKEDYIESVSSQ